MQKIKGIWKSITVGIIDKAQRKFLAGSCTPKEERIRI